MTTRNRASDARVWWLSPVAITVFVAALSMIPTMFLDDEEFRTLWRSPKSITSSTFLLFASGALALALGALVTMSMMRRRVVVRTEWPGMDTAMTALLRRSSTVLVSLTVLGYLGFAVLIVRAGYTPTDLLFASDNYSSGLSIRDTVGTIPGVTTLTQCGMASVVVSSILITQRFSRTELLKMIVVVGLSIPRAYVFSERLAILELVVPIAVVMCTRLATGSRARRRAAQLVPAVAIPAVAVVFSVFEYFRSWNFYRTTTSESFGQFALDRFAGYYATSLNNGHLVLTYLDWPGRLPYDTLAAFWTAPGISQLNLYEVLGGHADPYVAKGSEATEYASMLTAHGSPEFNNPSGYVGAFIDYGAIGGIVFFAIVGIVAGFLYRGFTDGEPFGLLLYPIVFIGLLEIPRYMHWAQGRTTYTWVALVIIAALLTRIRRRDARAAARASQGTEYAAPLTVQPTA